ncbi:hypothetical protein HBB16_11635 [Pseudonocardia sp. MCCB 268]|nr:hypothetical protein [Pseudonocardia cytotoxica]
MAPGFARSPTRSPPSSRTPGRGRSPWSGAVCCWWSRTAGLPDPDTGRPWDADTGSRCCSPARRPGRGRRGGRVLDPDLAGRPVYWLEFAAAGKDTVICRAGARAHTAGLPTDPIPHPSPVDDRASGGCAGPGCGPRPGSPAVGRSPRPDLGSSGRRLLVRATGRDPRRVVEDVVAWLPAPGAPWARHLPARINRAPGYRISTFLQGMTPACRRSSSACTGRCSTTVTRSTPRPGTGRGRAGYRGGRRPGGRLVLRGAGRPGAFSSPLRRSSGLPARTRPADAINDRPLRFGLASSY